MILELLNMPAREKGIRADSMGFPILLHLPFNGASIGSFSFSFNQDLETPTGAKPIPRPSQIRWSPPKTAASLRNRHYAPT